jgi:hypothetical protein
VPVCIPACAQHRLQQPPQLWLQPKGLIAQLNIACIHSHELSSFALANAPENANAKDDLHVLTRP